MRRFADSMQWTEEGGGFAIHAALNERLGFLRRTYAHLLIEICLVGAVSSFVLKTPYLLQSFAMPLAGNILFYLLGLWTRGPVFVYAPGRPFVDADPEADVRWELRHENEDTRHVLNAPKFCSQHDDVKCIFLSNVQFLRRLLSSDAAFVVAAILPPPQGV